VRSELYSLSPIRYDSQRILGTPRKQPRYVNKVPYKVLDAPDLQDDFYLNLVDWGSSNVLGVGLGSSVFMWNSQTGRVTKLCELKDDTVTSVSWIQRVSTPCKLYLFSIEMTSDIHREPTSRSVLERAWCKSGTQSIADVCVL
jgi:WD40 repeat protein